MMKTNINLILLVLLFIISKICIAQVKSDAIIPKIKTEQELISIIEGSEFDPPFIVILDFEEWPFGENIYIVAAYLPSSQERKDSYLATNEIDWDEEIDSDEIIILMIENKEFSRTMWSYRISLSKYTKYDGLSLRKYRVTDNNVAFGIKLITNEHYSGGWMTYYSLDLLILNDDDGLINIFSGNMKESGELAGEWITDENGEFMGRERVVLDSENEISFLTSKTDGFYDLELTGSFYNEETQNQAEAVAVKYRWNAELKMYSPINE